jgi:hypothetical protein
MNLFCESFRDPGERVIVEWKPGKPGVTLHGPTP